MVVDKKGAVTNLFRTLVNWLKKTLFSIDNLSIKHRRLTYKYLAYNQSALWDIGQRSMKAVVVVHAKEQELSIQYSNAGKRNGYLVDRACTNAHVHGRVWNFLLSCK